MLFIYFISELFLTVLVMLPTCFAIVLDRLVLKLFSRNCQSLEFCYCVKRTGSKTSLEFYSLLTKFCYCVKLTGCKTVLSFCYRVKLTSDKTIAVEIELNYKFCYRVKQKAESKKFCYRINTNYSPTFLP